jgi:hypothetical protein
VRASDASEGPEWQGKLDCGQFARIGGYPLRQHMRVAM